MACSRCGSETTAATVTADPPMGDRELVDAMRNESGVWTLCRDCSLAFADWIKGEDGGRDAE